MANNIRLMGLDFHVSELDMGIPTYHSEMVEGLSIIKEYNSFGGCKFGYFFNGERLSRFELRILKDIGKCSKEQLILYIVHPKFGSFARKRLYSGK